MTSGFFVHLPFGALPTILVLTLLVAAVLPFSRSEGPFLRRVAGDIGLGLARVVIGLVCAVGLYVLLMIAGALTQAAVIRPAAPPPPPKLELPA